MSSATSIRRSFRLKPEGTGDRPGAAEDRTETSQPGDAGFRAWHFFVLASLMMATVAVVMSRQSTPEHLVLTSLIIGAAGAAAAGFYRMLAPLVAGEASISNETLSQRSRAALEREKSLVLRSIKELEFDRAMGKLSPKDFDEMSERLRARALMLMKQVDQGGSGYRELIERELSARLATRQGRGKADAAVAGTPKPQVAGLCAGCGTVNDLDAVFCKRCGAKLAEART
jgi:hypothetical protein